MRASVYKLTHGVYLADLGDRQIKRGSVEDLAGALVETGIATGDLLLGDCREGAELLSASEQDQLRAGMTIRPDVVVAASDFVSSAAADQTV